jgi:hypothetical protein
MRSRPNSVVRAWCRRTPGPITPHLRQGRAVPTDAQEVADRPTRSADHARGTPGAAGPVRRAVQPPPAAPLPAAPGHTPATAYAARPKAAPGDRSRDTHDRVRTDIVDQAGSVTLRVNGRLHHIGVGLTHARTLVLLLVPCFVVAAAVVLSALSLNVARTPGTLDEGYGSSRPVTLRSAGRSPSTRVTAGLRAEVVTRYRQGETSREVAERCGIARSTTLKILRAEGVEVRPWGRRC